MNLFSFGALKIIFSHRYEPEGLVPLARFTWFASLCAAAFIILCGWVFGGIMIWHSLQDVVVQEGEVVRSATQLSHTDIRSTLGLFATRQARYKEAKESETLLSSPQR